MINSQSIKKYSNIDIEEIKERNKIKNRLYLEQTAGLGILPYTCSPDRYSIAVYDFLNKNVFYLFI